MSDRDDLFRRLLAAPEDDAPRLVYADWLDEHGQPERAEFVRLQCAMDRIPPKTGRWRPLYERAVRWSGEWKAHWAGPALERVLNAEFRRGFVDRVRLTVDQFLKSADELLTLEPVTVWEFASNRHVRPRAEHRGGRRRPRVRPGAGPGLWKLLAGRTGHGPGGVPVLDRAAAPVGDVPLPDAKALAALFAAARNVTELCGTRRSGCQPPRLVAARRPASCDTWNWCTAGSRIRGCNNWPLRRPWSDSNCCGWTGTTCPPGRPRRSRPPIICMSCGS